MRVLFNRFIGTCRSRLSVHIPNYSNVIRGVCAVRSFDALTSLQQNRNHMGVKHQVRYLNPQRAFPSYSIYSESCLLNMKLICPEFKVVSNDAITISNRGRLMFEFSPGNGMRGFNWDQKVTLALSTEEIGLCLSQLPHYPVTFSRSLGGKYDTGKFGDHTYDLVSATTNENFEKVMSLTPGDGATIQISIDHVKDGVGGHTFQGSGSVPMSIVLQAGEWEVLSTLMRDALPKLCGWTTMTDIQLKNAVMNAFGSSKDVF